MIIKISDSRVKAVNNKNQGGPSWLYKDKIESFVLADRETRKYIYARLVDSKNKESESYRICQYIHPTLYKGLDIKEADISESIVYSNIHYDTRSNVYILNSNKWESVTSDYLSSMVIYDGKESPFDWSILDFKYINCIEAVVKGREKPQVFFFDTYAYILNDEGKTIEVIR